MISFFITILWYVPSYRNHFRVTYIYLLKVGTKNTTGNPYRGHLHIWVMHDLQAQRSALQDVLVNPTVITGWVNGNYYVPTTETLGILPIPLEI